jgi:phosphoribosylformimino-5-aminoimidazole carboxamide ribotide isomerase
MQILPVLDLLSGQVVRGIGGRRDEYRPIVSGLTPSSVPLDVAQALREHFGFEELYLADLDAIMGARPALAHYQTLQVDGFRLWVDAGIREARDADFLDGDDVETIVAGLETLAGLQVLAALIEKYGSERIVFSLDLKAGKALGSREAWGTSDPEMIAREAYQVGIRRLLVLDLANVGGGKGPGTLELCRKLAATFPDLRLAAGGGIAGMADVLTLASSGVDTVLIASALHDGRITPRDL